MEIKQIYTGAYLLRLVGTIVRWISVGFSKSFKQLWDGPEDFEKQLDYALATKLIGMIILFLIIFALTSI